MTKFLFTLVLITITCFYIGSSLAQEKRVLTDKHKTAGLTCKDCHRTATPTKKPEMATCFSCHGSYVSMKELTKNLQPNPHGSHLGELSCNLCHSTHGNNTLYCSKCHNFLGMGFK